MIEFVANEVRMLNERLLEALYVPADRDVEDHRRSRGPQRVEGRGPKRGIMVMMLASRFG
jgi:hypothetical protein